MATLVVDKGLCGKSGHCVNICSSVFELDANGYAQVKAGADTTLPCVETAIGECGTGAIYWE